MEPFKYTPEHIKILPTFQGVANDMGDFFVPSDCMDCVCVRYGMIKHERLGQAWCLMIVSKMRGRLDLKVLWKPSEFSKDAWQADNDICCDSFDQLAKEHIIKN